MLPEFLESFVINGFEACVSPGGRVKFWQPDERPGAECGPGMVMEANLTAWSVQCELKVEMDLSGVALASTSYLRQLVDEV